MVLSGSEFISDVPIPDVLGSGFLDIEPGTTVGSVERLLERLPRPDLVKFVAIDGSRTIRKAVLNKLPKADVVLDKFHVGKMVKVAFLKVAQKVETPTKDKSFTAAMQAMKEPPRSLSNIRKRNMVSWLMKLPELRAAYEIRRQFMMLYDADISVGQARNEMEDWLSNLPATGIVGTAFAPVANFIEKDLNLICAYFDCRVTNARAESMNALIKLVDQEGRGLNIDTLRMRCLKRYGVEARQRAAKTAATTTVKRPVSKWAYSPLTDKSFWGDGIRCEPDGFLPLQERPDCIEKDFGPYRGLNRCFPLGAPP